MLHGLYQRIVKLYVLEVNTTIKMMSLDLRKEKNLSPVSVNVAFVALSLIKKLPTVNLEEVHEF